MPTEDELSAMPVINGSNGSVRYSGDERPGDRFARETSWNQILEPAGWVEVPYRGDGQRWRRPGKADGVSATSGGGGFDLFYCFSSNGDPFEAHTPYSKFAAHAVLNHGGDFKAAARELVMYESSYQSSQNVSFRTRQNETTNSRSALRLLNTRELLETEPEPLVWPIDGISAAGHFTMVDGREKSGKSLVMMACAKVAATGGGCIAGITIAPGRVLIIDAENGEKLIHRRLHGLGIDPQASDDFKIAEARGFDLRRNLAEVERYMDLYRPDIVILDSFRTLWSGRERDEDEVPQALTPLSDLAHDSGVSLNLLHHSQKGGDEYRGSTAIGAAVDWGVHLERVYGDKDVTRRKLTNPLPRIDAQYPPRWIRIVREGDFVRIEEAEPYEGGENAAGGLERLMLNVSPVGAWHTRKDALDAFVREGLGTSGTFKDVFSEVSRKPIFERGNEGREVTWRVKLANSQ